LDKEELVSEQGGSMILTYAFAFCQQARNILDLLFYFFNPLLCIGKSLPRGLVVGEQAL
jgi:hypothetical protein